MRHSSGLNNDLTDEQVEVFRVLYPIFKDEVFQRREQMMRLTAFASAFLVMLLITILALSPLPGTTSPIRWFAISGVALFSGLFAYLILQHADRHRMAKQQLIELEKVFGLYENSWQLSGNALFPKNWQSDWTIDRSVSIYLTILAALTALVICAMLVRV
ncbi:MAG: hypothetical protein JSU60_08545 [Nitrospirota bacterium]|nr:MAG: hypothetical protein JSU60_08545 [Nitrospirota bacterium]